MTREPGYERFLSDGDAIFVDPEPAEIRAALLRLVNEERHRKEVADRARAVGAREFGVERFVDAYERLYSAVAGRH